MWCQQKKSMKDRQMTKIPTQPISQHMWNMLEYVEHVEYKLFGLLSKLLASLMRNYFPKRPSGAPLHTLSKLYDVPVGFVTPPRYFEAEYCLFCGRRRVAVARYRMICLVHVLDICVKHEKHTHISHILIICITHIFYM